jgi:hypothetical protein
VAASLDPLGYSTDEIERLTAAARDGLVMKLSG